MVFINNSNIKRSKRCQQKMNQVDGRLAALLPDLGDPAHRYFGGRYLGANCTRP